MSRTTTSSSCQLGRPTEPGAVSESIVLAAEKQRSGHNRWGPGPMVAGWAEAFCSWLAL
jgi:hypothetical protein